MTLPPRLAETDATKRALMTFGNAFGLSTNGGAGATPCVRRAPADQGGGGASRAGTPGSQGAGDIGGERRGSHLSATVPTTSSAMASAGVPAADIFPGDRDEPGFRPIDKSVLALAEPRRIRDPEHLRFVAGQPCWSAGGRLQKPITSALPSPAP